MRSWVSLLVAAAVVVAGVVLFRNKDQLLAYVGFGAAPGAAATATPGAPGGQAPGAGGAGGPGGPGGPGAPGGAAARARVAAAVITVAAETRDVPITVSAVGWVEPSATVAVRSRVDGYVIKQAVVDGQNVKAGDVLFQLDDAAIQATIAQHRAAAARDTATVNQLTADVTRLTALAEVNAATRTQLDQTKTNLVVAQANLNADNAILQADQIQLGFTTITAPIAGRVGLINTTSGALVRANDQTALLTITRMAPVRITFNIPQRQLDSLRKAMSGPSPAAVYAYDPETGAQLSQGLLTYIDSTVDTTTGTVVVKAEFANADGKLWPGQYLRTEVAVGMHQGVTVVPMASVQMNANGAFVYLVRDSRAVIQQVTVSENAGQFALIANGVRPGDHVILEAARLVNNQAIIETLRGADGTTTQPAARTGGPVAGGAEANARPAGAANPAAGGAGGNRPQGAPGAAEATAVPGGGQNPAAGGFGNRAAGAGAAPGGAATTGALGNAAPGAATGGAPQQRPAGAGGGAAGNAAPGAAGGAQQQRPAGVNPANPG